MDPSFHTDGASSAIREILTLRRACHNPAFRTASRAYGHCFAAMPTVSYRALSATSSGDQKQNGYVRSVSISEAARLRLERCDVRPPAPPRSGASSVGEVGVDLADPQRRAPSCRHPGAAIAATSSAFSAASATARRRSSARVELHLAEQRVGVVLEPVEPLLRRGDLVLGHDVRAERQVHRDRRDHERRRLDAVVAAAHAVGHAVVAAAADAVDEQVAREHARRTASARAPWAR